MVTTEHNLELLNDAYAAFLRDDSAKLESRLFDAAVACGMDHDEPVVRDWAAVRLFDWLASPATVNWCDCGAQIDASEEQCAACADEYHAEFAMSEDV